MSIALQRAPAMPQTHEAYAPNPSLLEDWPEGFRYREEFIEEVEEADLLDRLRDIEFSTFEMHGVPARRRVAFFGESTGGSYGSAVPIPEFALAVRGRLAAWADIAPEQFAMMLVTEYQPGAPIGWHRDASQYGIVAGMSLGSSCRMKFRPYATPSALGRAAARAPRRATHDVVLAPRSAYLITGPSRTQYEHSIPAVRSLRYSVTFRTLRRQPSA